MREADTERLRRIAAARRAAQGVVGGTSQKKAAPTPVPAEILEDAPEEFADALDEVDDEATREADEDAYMREVVESFDVVRAYETFANKGPVSGKEDSSGNIFVRCPTRDHVDNNPSAQVKPSTNAWVCHACGIGGDPIALVAATMGLDYRAGRDYMEVTKEICRAAGHEFWVDSFGREHIVLPILDDDEPETAPEQAETAPEVPVHGDGTGLDDFFDPEEALAQGTLTRAKPEPLPAELDFMLDSLDEVGSSGTKEDKIRERMAARKAEKAAQNPQKSAPKPSKKVVEAPKIGAGAAKTAPKPPPGLPRFNIGAMVEGKQPPAPRIAAPVERFEDETDTDEPKTAAPGSAAPAEASAATDAILDPTKYPSINWRELVPQGTFIHDYMTHASQDDVIEEFHFWNALMAIGLACRRDLMLADAPPVYGNLFVCAVAKTGAKKSKANALFRRVVQNCGPLKIHDHGSTEGIRFITKPNSGEALIDAFIGKKEIPPPSGSKAPPTNEVFPIAGLLQISELSGLLRAAARKESTLETYLIQMYDCEDEVSSASRGSGTTVAPSPYLCLSAGVQPSLIRTLVSKDMTDSGFANRFVWAYGPPKKRQALGDPKEYPAAVGRLSLKLAEVRRNVESAGVLEPAFGGRILYWDPPAEQLWRKFFAEVVNPAWIAMRDSDPASRAELLMKKLILLFTVNMGKTSVPPEAVEQAIVMWDYISATYSLMGSNLTSTLNRDNEEYVLGQIELYTKKHKQGPTQRELYEACKRDTTIDIETLGKIIANMIRSELIAEYNPNAGKRGRPTKRYRLLV